MPRLSRFTCLLASAALAAAAPPPTGESLQGDVVHPFAAATGQRALLLFFVAPDCPISNRYAPTISAIAMEAAEHGVRTWLVYSDDLADPDAIRTHQTDYNLQLPTAIDRNFAIANFVGADATPEAAVYAFTGENRAPQLVYRGRIDDQYEGFGRYRPAATQSELTDTLEQIAIGHTPTLVTTKAIGCYIPRPN